MTVLISTLYKYMVINFDSMINFQSICVLFPSFQHNLVDALFSFLTIYMFVVFCGSHCLCAVEYLVDGVFLFSRSFSLLALWTWCVFNNMCCASMSAALGHLTGSQFRCVYKRCIYDKQRAHRICFIDIDEYVFLRT